MAKFCPLKLTGNNANLVGHKLSPNVFKSEFICEEGKCEWWNRGENCCSIKLIADSIAGISRATR